MVTIDGGVHPIELELTAEGVRLDAPTEVAARAAERVRAWFGLDTDVRAIAHALGGDALLGPLLAARPGLRATQYPEAFEAAVMAVLGQQVSVAAARTFGGRAVAALGCTGERGLRLFPTPEAFLRLPLDELRAAIGVTVARARTVQATAAAFAGGLVLDRRRDRADQRRSLLAIPGIGPWTADYLALRLLGDPDAFPAGDLVLRRALGNVPTADAEAASQAWRPHRAHAAFHLWASNGAI